MSSQVVFFAISSCFSLYVSGLHYTELGYLNRVCVTQTNACVSCFLPWFVYQYMMWRWHDIVSVYWIFLLPSAVDDEIYNFTVIPVWYIADAEIV